MKLIVRLISLFVKISWVLEIADVVFVAMYSPSNILMSLRFITVPTIIIASAVYLFWLYTDEIKKARRQLHTADQKRKRQIKEQWKKEYETFYNEMHGDDNY